MIPILIIIWVSIKFMIYLYHMMTQIKARKGIPILFLKDNGQKENFTDMVACFYQKAIVIQGNFIKANDKAQEHTNGIMEINIKEIGMIM